MACRLSGTRTWAVVLVAAALGLSASPASAAIRRIQRVTAASSSASPNTVTVTWYQPTKPKNLLVCVVGMNDSSATVTTYPTGFVSAIRGNNSGRNGVEIFYYAAAPAQAGAQTWIITSGFGFAEATVTCIEYAGAKFAPLDRTGTLPNASSGTSASASTSLATTQADELAVAAFNNDDSQPTSSWGNSFNELSDLQPTVPTTQPPYTSVGDRILTSTGTITASVGYTIGPTAISGAIATFKAETSTTRYWRCSIQSNFDDNTCWSSTSGNSTNDVPAPDTLGTMTAIFNSTGVGDAIVRFDPNLVSLQINSGYTGTVRQMTGGTQGLVGEWYDGVNFNTYMGTHIDGPISFSGSSGWNTSLGGPRTNSTDGQTFSVRWTGQVYAPVSGNYVFRGNTDDGVRLWVNGTQVINNWVGKGESESVGSTIALTAGTWYDITLEYYQNGGGYACELRWTHPSQATSVMVPAAYLRTKGSTGVQTDYHDGMALGSFKHRDLSSNVATYETSNWDDLLAGMITDSYTGETYSVRWTGQLLAAYSQSYTFKVFRDDGVRLWVNGQLLIDSWANGYGSLTGSPSITLTAGQWYDFRVDYFENGSGAELQLSYLSTSQAETVIPATAMRGVASMTLGSFTQAAGTFMGGAGRIDVAGAFTATGGAFTAPAALVVDGNLNTSGSTFSHNSGRIVLGGTGSQTVTPGASTTYNDLYVNPSLVGYWPLDEASVTATSTAVDVSGYGHTAYHVNTPVVSSDVTSDEDFYNMQSLVFTAATRHALRTPLTDQLKPTSAVTVAFWYKATAVDTGGSSDVVSGGNSYVVALTSTAVQFYHRTGGASNLCSFTTTPLDGNWHHVAASHSTATGTYIFFDGVWSAGCASDLTAIDYDQGTELWIGRHGNGGTTADFGGQVDDVRIFNTAFDATQMSALANGFHDGSATGTFTLASNLTLAGSMYLDSGTLDVSATPYNITVGSSWWNMGGRFTPRTGTVTLSGTLTNCPTAESCILQSNNEPFYNLTHSGSSYMPSYSRTSVDGTIAVSAGAMDTYGWGHQASNIVETNSAKFRPSSGGQVVLMPRANVSPVVDDQTWDGYMRVEVPDEPNLVRYYKFDDLHGTTMRDSTRSTYDGVALGGVSWSKTLPSAIDFVNWGSLYCDGVNDSVYFTAPAASKISLAAWIQPLDAGDTFYRIVSMPAYKWWISRAGGGANNAMALQLRMDTGSGSYIYQSAANSVTYGSWQHVMVVFDSTTFSSADSSTWPKFYVNGALSTTTAVSTTTGTFLSNSGDGYICDNSSNLNNFAGYVDDVRIYDTTLTATHALLLYQGVYPMGSSNYTVSLASNLTTNYAVQVDSGTLDLGGYTVTSSLTSTPVRVYNGALRIGSGTLTAAGGLTVFRAGDLVFNGAGTLSLGSGKVLTMDGTWTSSSGAVETIQSVTGTYSFTVNSDTANPNAVIDVDGLNIKNTDTSGLNVAKATSSTFTNFKNVTFSNGTGARYMYINGDSVNESFPGLAFDVGVSAATTNNLVVAGTGSRYYLENRGVATNGNGAGESRDGDNDNDTTPNGLADSGGSVVQWLWSAPTDTAGSVVGFPTAAFNWSNFTYYSTYVAMKNIDGSTDRVYVRNTNGDPKGATYHWDLPSGKGDIIGTPRWDTIDNVKYVYVSTTLGFVYKLIDSGTALAAPVVSPWDTPYNQGTNATVASGLLTDSNYIYWVGLNTSSNPTLFRLSNASKGTATTQSLTANVSAALALDNPAATPYLMAAATGYLYRYDVTNNTAPSASQHVTLAAIDGRVVVLNNQLYAVDNAGKLIVHSTTNLASATWTHQDTTNHACSSGSNCQAKSLYVNVEDYLLTSGKPRVVYGDKDGHVYIVKQNGSGSTPTVFTGYSNFKPNSDANTYTSSPLYQSGILVTGNDNGKVYVINAFTASGPATPSLIQTYDFGTGVQIASIGRDRGTNSNAGAYMVATSNGKLYWIPASTDGDAFR